MLSNCHVRRPQLLLDPHLHDHVAPLYQASRGSVPGPLVPNTAHLFDRWCSTPALLCGPAAQHEQPCAPCTLQAVRNKALMQYATPFSALDLNAMAAFFNTTAG